MKAIVRHGYGTPDWVRLEDVPDPIVGDGDVLVRIHAASVNRTDFDGVRGKPLLYRAFMGLRRPRNDRLGLDAAGVVEAVGPGVTRYKPGDRVYSNLTNYGLGAFAELKSAPEKAWHPIPECLDFDQASTVPEGASWRCRRSVAGMGSVPVTRSSSSARPARWGSSRSRSPRRPERR